MGLTHLNICCCICFSDVCWNAFYLTASGSFWICSHSFICRWIVLKNLLPIHDKLNIWIKCSFIYISKHAVILFWNWIAGLSTQTTCYTLLSYHSNVFPFLFTVRHALQPVKHKINKWKSEANLLKVTCIKNGLKHDSLHNPMWKLVCYPGALAGLRLPNTKKEKLLHSSFCSFSFVKLSWGPKYFSDAFILQTFQSEKYCSAVTVCLICNPF